MILFEGYRTDLQEMELELEAIQKQIEDFREIINSSQVKQQLSFEFYFIIFSTFLLCFS
jgi:hypothetical protein